MEKIIAGLVQMDSGPDMNENMRMAEQYVREAAEQGAKLILFPETAEYTGADMPGHASAVPGYVSRRFSSLAKRYGVYLHCGSMTVRRHPGRPSNTSFLFGPDGETIAEYSKIHMFDVNIPGSVSYEESREICPGNEIVLADTALRHEHLLRYPLSGTVPADGILRSRCISDSGGFYESNGRAPLGSTAAHARH